MVVQYKQLVEAVTGPPLELHRLVLPAAAVAATVHAHQAKLGQFSDSEDYTAELYGLNEGESTSLWVGHQTRKQWQ